MHQQNCCKPNIVAITEAFKRRYTNTLIVRCTSDYSKFRPLQA